MSVLVLALGLCVAPLPPAGLLLATREAWTAETAAQHAFDAPAMQPPGDDAPDRRHPSRTSACPTRATTRGGRAGRPCTRHWCRAAIAVLSVGGALSSTAIVFGTIDPCRRGIGNSCQEAAARRAAHTVGSPGALMIAGGAAWLAVGLVRKRELRASLAVGRDGAVLEVLGRS